MINILFRFNIYKPDGHSESTSHSTVRTLSGGGLGVHSTNGSPTVPGGQVHDAS